MIPIYRRTQHGRVKNQVSQLRNEKALRIKSLLSPSYHHPTNHVTKSNFTTLALAALLIATIGWSLPNADVQPEGRPGLIQDGIRVESVQDTATVRAIDLEQRTITLALADGTVNKYGAVPNLKNFDRIKVGQNIKAIVTYKLAVYLLADGRLPDGSTAQSLGVNAKVLLVDPSYRLLTLKYPNGGTEIFKVPLGTKVLKIAPGDSVVKAPGEITRIRIEDC